MAADRPLSGAERPAEAFPPGDTILEEMRERGWNRIVLADKLNWTDYLLAQVLYNRYPLTRRLANDLERVFGVQADFWLNLQRQYLAWLREVIRG